MSDGDRDPEVYYRAGVLGCLAILAILAIALAVGLRAVIR